MALEAFDGKMKASNHKFHTLDDLWQSISSHAPKTTKQNHHSMIFLYNIVYISLYIYIIYNILGLDWMDSILSQCVMLQSPILGPFFQCSQATGNPGGCGVSAATRAGTGE
jgi:hypothetical protein